MRNVFIVTGRLTGPTSVELDEPVPELNADIEVMVQVKNRDGEKDSVFDFLRKLAPGSRTKDDIDRQIRTERDAWGDRA